MTAKNDILVAIKLLAPQSEELDDSSGQDLASAIKDCLQQTGDQENNVEGLLLFSFKKLNAAYFSVFNCLKQIKKEFDGNFSQNKLPVQIIFHYPSNDGAVSEDICTPNSTIWNTLADDVLYVTDSLKTNWFELPGNIDLPAHLFERKDNNLFQVRFFSKENPKEKQYFPHRDLTVQGKMQECFYCGIKSHSPAQCPGKLLSPELQGISDIGYLSITDIGKYYQQVFSELRKYTDIFEAGVSYSEIRKNPALLIFVTFFDLLKIYQPRFLWNLAFSESQVWEDSLGTFPGKQDNRNLAIGFDCLRVGQYQQASAMFDKEFKRPFGKYFYATVGQAFIALETGCVNDMRPGLRKAELLANNQKEKVYIALLSARVHALSKNWEHASKVLSKLLGTVYKCVDAKYARIQMEVNCGATERTLKQLRDIIQEHEEYFIMVLLDPMLLPAQDLVEEMLAAIFREKEQEAQEELLEVRKTCDHLMTWADTEDKEVMINLQALEELENKFKRNSFFGSLDVAERCNGVNYGFKQIQKRQLNKITRDIKALTARYNQSVSYWEGYSYQSLFQTFSEQLKGLKRKIAYVRSLLESNKGTALREAIDVLATTRNDFDKLDKTKRKMSRAEMVVEGILMFGKNLLILEILFIATGLSLLVISSIVEPEIFADGLISNLIMISTVIAAPAIAFVTSLVKVINKYL